MPKGKGFPWSVVANLKRFRPACPPKPTVATLRHAGETWKISSSSRLFRLSRNVTMMLRVCFGPLLEIHVRELWNAAAEPAAGCAGGSPDPQLDRMRGPTHARTPLMPIPT